MDKKYIDSIIPTEVIMMLAFMVLVLVICYKMMGTALACCYLARRNWR